MKTYLAWKTKTDDQVQQAIDTGIPYQTLLAPPSVDPGMAHPAWEGGETSEVFRTSEV